ncbi:MAG: hypothetical protein DRO76_05455 [Candidatus Altiarchaeales archaeon]|nr:MAG: hypothetical protein DRO76_05455 [Candidatus Altiarchaeales archaeon]
MFKPVQMRKIRVLVLDHYLDRVMKVLGRLRSVQITRIMEEDIEPISREKISDYSHILNRISHLIDVLKIRDKEIKKVPIDEKSSEEYMSDIENMVIEIEKEVIPISEKLKRIVEEKNILKNDELALNCLDRIGVDVKWLGTSDFLYTTAGFLDLDKIEELESLIWEKTEEKYLILKKLFQDRFSVVIVTLKEYQNDVEGVLKGLNFDILEPREKNLREVRERLKLIKETEEGLQRDLNRIGDERFKDLLVAREIVQIEKNTQEIMLNFGKTDRIYVIEGWIPTKDVDDLVEEIENASKGYVVIRIYKPKPDENVPVLLQNPKIFKPFESITNMFGLPSYTEIDPTPIMAVTFPLIFGLMFGDVGHGFVLALAGLGLITLKKGNKSLWNFGMILLYCGILAMIFGFLYASVFGNEKILSNLYESWGIGRTYTIAGGETLRALWRIPSHDIEYMIGIALFVGVLHMGVGLIVNAVNNVHEKGFGTIVHSLSKIWFFCGEVTIIASLFKFKIPFFQDIARMYPLIGAATLTETILNPILLFGIYIPVGLMLMSELTHGLQQFSIKKLFGLLAEGLFEIFETFSMLLSNTISYSRIAILAVIHAMMCLAIYEIAGIEAISDIFILSILIIAGGNILVLVLEGLIVFIHTIRLHFYEWFTKFYSSGGIEYTPFRIERKYTQLSDQGE